MADERHAGACGGWTLSDEQERERVEGGNMASHAPCVSVLDQRYDGSNTRTQNIASFKCCSETLKVRRMTSDNDDDVSADAVSCPIITRHVAWAAGGAWRECGSTGALPLQTHDEPRMVNPTVESVFLLGRTSQFGFLLNHLRSRNRSESSE